MKEKNLFSIGEIAKSIGITRRIILNYEAKGLITPDKKEGDSGNRYYTIDNFTKIRTVRIFQNLGLSLDEIREYFADKVELQPMISRLEAMRDELNLSIEKLKERAQNSSDIIKEITVEPQTVFRKTVLSPSVAERTVILRETALEAMRKFGTDTTRRMYFIEYPLSNPDKISFCVAVPPESRGENVFTLPKFSALSFFHHGPYEDIPKTREKLVKYAEKNGFSHSATCRHVYLEGPPQHKDPNKFITQIILPLV